MANEKTSESEGGMNLPPHPAVPELRPEFLRFPKGNNPCPYTGMSRSGLYNLCVPCKANKFRPAVPGKCLRQPGNLTGVWLIPFAELIAYLRSLPTPTPGQPVDDPVPRRPHLVISRV